MKSKEKNWDKIPDVITMEQLYRLCHIGKKTARYLLKSGKIPCKYSGKKTRCYKILKKDVMEYLSDREKFPEFYKAVDGWYDGHQALRADLSEIRNAPSLKRRYVPNPCRGNAYEVMQTKTYADYIATRPKAERFGSHGLFTDDGVQVKLSEVSDELNHHDGNVWTVIISLRREDAERLGYNNGERWRDMLRRY